MFRLSTTGRRSESQADRRRPEWKGLQAPNLAVGPLPLGDAAKNERPIFIPNAQRDPCAAADGRPATRSSNDAKTICRKRLSPRSSERAVSSACCSPRLTRRSGVAAGYIVPKVTEGTGAGHALRPRCVGQQKQTGWLGRNGPRIRIGNRRPDVRGRQHGIIGMGSTGARPLRRAG